MIIDKIVPISVMTNANIVLSQRCVVMNNSNVESNIMKMMFMVLCMIAHQMKYAYQRDVFVRIFFLRIYYDNILNIFTFVSKRLSPQISILILFKVQ